MSKIISAWNSTSLIIKIIIGLVIGTVLGIVLPQATFLSVLGSLFVGALKAIAPILVFFLVASSLCRKGETQAGVIKTVVILYVLSTLVAGFIAVIASYAFPVKMVLTDVTAVTDSAPVSVFEVINNLLMKIVQNPIAAIAEANYLGILTWACFFGLLLRGASDTTKNVLTEVADVISDTVRVIISLAPFGILGLAYSNMVGGGFDSFISYGKLIILLVSCMLFQYFVVNPAFVFWCIRKNPYKLVFYCLRQSAITAFFTRSSAANIPVNMEAAQNMGLDPDTYSVTLPLGATVNMDGAAITITCMTLATCWTLGLQVDLPSAFILSILATVAAAGASGVAGGSLLLIPLACSLFGIGDAISMQVVAVGFLIGVIQDSVETALNSSSDLMITAAAEFRQWRKEGKKIPF